MKKFYAHSLEGSPVEQWQPLQVHLENVAWRGREFAGMFGAARWGYCAGILHDAGKATGKFQKRLEGSNIRVDHSSFGARTAKEQCGRLGILLSYIIAGHHGELPDGGRQQGQLHYRLQHA
ncbi:CRISPR-associated endonuclease Cas3'' [Desulfomarina sp.]